MNYELTKWMTENRTKATNWKGQAFRWMEHKHDGVRLAIIKERDGTLRAIQRKSYWNYLGQLPQWLQGLARELPNGTIIDGELTCPGNATEVSSYLARDQEKLIYTAFAMPWNNGQLTTNTNLLVVREVLEDRGFSVPLIWEGKVPPTEEFVVKMAEDLGFEGFMMKADHWHCWWKCKPVKTVDCIVLGWYPGKPGTQYEHGLGGFRIGVYRGRELVEISRCGGGFDKEQRLNPEFREAMLDQVIEVAYDKVDGGGGLRFPRFKRIRHDKPAKECTDVQLM